MGLLSMFQKFNPIEELVTEAQEGNQSLRDNLISKYTPFIISVISSYLNRYISRENDEEVIVGMEAFNEAIDSYNPSKGQSFLAFARLLIKRRLVDYIRKNNNTKSEVPLTAFEHVDDEGNMYNSADSVAAASSYQKVQQNIERRQDIEIFKEILCEYNITLENLVDNSPKHKDARGRAIEAAKVIASNQQMKWLLLSKKTLPLVQLAEISGIPRKTLERNRKYIIAVTIILINDLNYLKEYLKEY